MWNRFYNWLYNQDRAIASLFGAPPQETISSEAGRKAQKEWWAALLAKGLNAIQPGHTDIAIKHADALDKVDDGQEK